ncbi:Response regulator rcp1 [Paraglaciecola mesophila]|uniref:Response regulator rcp1 n=1 Tax=Paraglaciecola mesophila TaxID=197222 RepID=A0A857JDG1_9ALTE|nr:response regulator transcription factor [Paraglaciecola mesophila]QHJ10063.1 Response regulator rcp1 [Paraglaciecola mesophila]
MKLNRSQHLHFLMVDSDEDDTVLMQEAFAESNSLSHLNCVKDEVQLIDYLDGRGVYQNRELYPLPNIILLELRAPTNKTFDALTILKKSSEFRRVPVVIFANSMDESLVANAYDLGAASYIVKPNTFDALLKIVQGCHEYWSMCARPVLSHKPKEITALNEPVILNTQAAQMPPH